MSREELQRIYGQFTPGPRPTGYYRGEGIVFPGSRLRSYALPISRFLWAGKTFYDNGNVQNWGVGVVPVAPATFSMEASWYDGKPCWALDYSKRSILFRSLRDEIREISPGIYLGLVYIRGVRGPSEGFIFTLDKDQPGFRSQ